ncbi:MAG: hypothetical protein ACREDK_01705 [Thermoplasmata archaeon]
MLERYPPKDAALSVRGPPTPPPAAPPSPARPLIPPPPSPTASSAPTAPGAPAAPPRRDLLSLDRPFDVDEFSQVLGETQIQVEVPREALVEVLRRVCDFMGFGIYVYSVTVRPAPTELLKRFVVELQRVDFEPATSRWVPFQEKGRSESPFGPNDSR